MAAFTKPKRRYKEEIERLRGGEDQINIIDLRFERRQVVGLNEVCWGKATTAYTKPKRRYKEEIERLRGSEDQINIIDLRFERWQVVGFRKGRKQKCL